MNIFTLTGLQLALQAKLEAQGFDEQTILDTLEGETSTDELLEKRLGYIAIIKQKRAFGEARAKAANDMATLAETEIRDADRMQSALMSSMAATGDKQVIGLHFEAWVRNNPPAVDISDKDSLPAEYWTTPEPKPPVAAPDKAAIKNAIKSGVVVPGASMKHTTRLEIR